MARYFGAMGIRGGTKLKAWIGGLLAATMLAWLPSTVRADQITLSNSSQDVTLVSNGNGTLNIELGGTSAPFTLSGAATFGSASGTYSFSTSQVVTAGPNNGSGVFPISPSTGVTTFTYSDGVGDSLSGKVIWTAVYDGSPNPHFGGSILITSSSGSTQFTSLFHPGIYASFDFTLNTVTTTLDTLAGDPEGTSEAVTVSSGEVTGGVEPGSLALFAIGLLMVAALWRRNSEFDSSARAA